MNLPGSRSPRASAVADEPAMQTQTLKALTRRMPTGVAVLTVAHEGTLHAATVSTLCAVSQQPLTISASLRTASLFTHLAVGSGTFAVNILGSRQALLADWFANPKRPSGARQFDLIDWKPEESTGIPLVNGALAHLVCRVTSQVPVGEADSVLVAEVTSGHSGSGRPLINFDGQLYDAEFRDVVRRQGWRDADQPTWD